MLDIIARLIAIKYFAKDIHYTAYGDGFYGIHLLMDRVAEGMDEFVDSIKEVSYLGEGKTPPTADTILKVTNGILPVRNETSQQENIKSLLELITDTISHVSDISGESGVADANLLGNIAQDLKLKKGLLERQIALSIR